MIGPRIGVRASGGAAVTQAWGFSTHPTEIS
jgi:hypothetical protein